MFAKQVAESEHSSIHVRDDSKLSCASIRSKISRNRQMLISKDGPSNSCTNVAQNANPQREVEKVKANDVEAQTENVKEVRRVANIRRRVDTATPSSASAHKKASVKKQSAGKSKTPLIVFSKPSTTSA